MEIIKNKRLVSVIALGMLIACCGVNYAYSDNANIAVNITVQQNVKGVVNWEKGSSSNVEAIGLGLPPVNISGTRGAMLARRAAVIDAYRQLAEVINGVQVDSETTMRELVLESDIVKTKTQALIKGAHIVEEHINEDGSYSVKLVLPLYGASSIASVAIPEIKVNEYPVPQLGMPKTSASVPAASKVEISETSVAESVAPKVETPKTSAFVPAASKVEISETSVAESAASKVEIPETSAAESAASKVEKPVISNNIANKNIESALATKVSDNQNTYTGVVVDASGLGLEGTFSPLIYDESGRIIYGMRNIDKEYAISHGMVEYSNDTKNQIRAGSNPFMIKAVSVKGGVNSVNRVNVVVSMEDAEKILQLNSRYAVLDNKAVVFVK